MKKHTFKKIILDLIIIVSAIVFIVCTGTVAKHEYEVRETQKEFELINKAEYGDLKSVNDDMIGQIYIPDTVIDYPVMQPPLDNQDYYLNLSFDRKYSTAGSIFSDVITSDESKNQIFYGHHMWDGSMFGNLEKYVNDGIRTVYYDRFLDNSGLTFDHGTYQIIAAFKTSSHYDETIYDYADIISEDSFNKFRDLIVRNNELSDEFSLEYGDETIVLSTCSYHIWNNGALDHSGRYVVIAKKISSEELVNRIYLNDKQNRN